eukprot:CFRG0803T1
MVCPMRVAGTALVAFMVALSMYYSWKPTKVGTNKEEERRAASELKSGTESLLTSMLVRIGVKLEHYRYVVGGILLFVHIELLSQGAICRYLFVNNPVDIDVNTGSSYTTAISYDSIQSAYFMPVIESLLEG